MAILEDQRRAVPAASQFAEREQTVPWWQPTPEEDARYQAMLAEFDEHAKAITEGRAEPLTRAQIMVGRHMQA